MAERTDPILPTLRATLLVLLFLLVLRPPGGRREVVELDAAIDPSSVTDARVVVRRSLAPPLALELEVLAGLGRVVPIVAARPDGPVRLEVEQPRDLRQGRNGAVAWTVRGSPGDTVHLQLSDAAGPLDSARIAIGSDRQATGAFRIRPGRAGWQAWTVRTAEDGQTVGGWVLPPDTPRVLIVSGPMSIEAREAARALERAGGFDVHLAPALGRDLRLGDAPAGLPGSATDMGRWDVILVLDGVAVTRAQADLLREFVAGGGGLLTAGGAADSPGLAMVTGTGELAGDTILWSVPAELDPLPALGRPVAASWLQPANPFVHVAAAGRRGALLLLAQPGRGRWAGLGIADTWRWSMEGGRLPALAAFWSSLVAWLGGGLHGPLRVEIEPAWAPPGTPIDVRLDWYGEAGAEPTAIVLGRPAESSDSLAVAWRNGSGATRFVAAGEGGHVLRGSASDRPLAGHQADSAASAGPDAWARLALIAAASSGRMVPPDSVDAVVDALAPRGGAAVLSWWLAAAAVMVALAEWTLRRWRGLA